MFDRRITLFCGHYGSGKTEISINAALDLRRRNDKVALVDLDIVNPYFRSAEQHDVLESAGVRLLCPTFAMTTVDIPGLPASIQSVFDVPVEKVVFDVGGDETGSVALGRYKQYFDKDDYEMLFVINVMRPFSNNVDDIQALYERICARARMQAAGIINNTNYGPRTTAQDVERGHEVVLRAAERLGLPVRAVTATQEVMRELPPALADIGYAIKTRMVPEWML